MFHEMRRKKQILSHDECVEILDRATAGVLAVSGDEYPYAVPLSYTYHDGKIIFHSARTGHKLDLIAQNEKVSFCVIDKDEIVADEYTTYFRSVIIFGKAHVVEDDQEKKDALVALAEKYAPLRDESQHMHEIDKSLKATCVVEISIDHMTGKEAKELVNKRS